MGFIINPFWAAVAGITPASFPGLLRWYKADSFTGLSDGDRVGGGLNPGPEWFDQTGSGDDADHPTDGPEYKTNIVGTKPIIRFALAAGAHLNFAPGSRTDFTFMAASARTGGTSFIVQNPSVGHQIRRAFFDSNVIFWFDGTSTVSDTGLSGAATDFMVTTVRRSGTTVTLRQNKTAVGSGSGSAGFLVTEIGSSANGSQMDLGEFMVWTSALSDTDVDDLYDNYLKPRWVSLP